MSFDYFYGQQSDLFTFYRVPKVLFTNERFWNISADAKMLYGILLDRMSLSAKNGWIDKNGRVYIIFTIDEAKMALNCAEQKAIKLLSELEKKAGLIERKRQGLGKPNLIYVKNFISAVDSQLLNCENHNSGTMEITTQELPKSQCNNTDIKNTEFSDTDSIFPSGNGGMMDENDRYQEYFDYFSDQLSMDLLKKDYPYDSEMLDNILELIVETVCTKRPLIRIGAEERPTEIVRSRFMKLNAEHIRYVMDCFKENTTSHRVSLGTDARGNIIRLDNALSSIPEKLEKAHEQLTNLQNQQEATRAELGKPFPQEAELAEKSARLAELDAALNMEDSMPEREEAEQADIKANEKRMVEIGALQTHINNYSRTRSVYEAYRKSGYSIKFFEEHREEIQIHKAAKKAFDQLPGKKVPTRQSLNEEYHRLLSGKKEAYAEYRQVKKDMQEYLIAKQTVEHILGIDRKNRIITQQQNLD